MAFIIYFLTIVWYTNHATHFYISQLGHTTVKTYALA